MFCCSLGLDQAPNLAKNGCQALNLPHPTLGRNGGDMTWCAANDQSGLRYTESSMTRCCASTSQESH